MNAVIYRKNSDIVSHFLSDCVKCKNNLVGSNKKIGINTKYWDILWTEDDVNPILDSEGKIIAWDKMVSEITPSINLPVEKTEVTQKEYSEAFKIRQLIDHLSYQELDNYIESNVTDLPSAKVFLKRLSKVVLALARIADKEGR